MIIPFQQLSPDALLGLIEAYVTQQGMDQFDIENSMSEKVEFVQQYLEKGDVVIVFDGITESCNIVSKEAADQFVSQPQPEDGDQF